MRYFRISVVVVIILCSIVVIIWAFRPDTAPGWTGFGSYVEKTDEHRAKTLWDWLDLLIVPAIVALFAWTFKESEKEKTAKNEEERSQNATLDSFINIMTELMFKNDLAGSTASVATKSIARTRINLALNYLNGPRKGIVIQFLYEGGLISKSPKLSLVGSDIKNAILDGIVLRNVEIKGAHFQHASLKKSNLQDSIFIGCDFSEADLTESLVENVDLSYTNFTNAKLTNMDLTSVNLEGSNLTNADLRESKITRRQLDGIFEKDGIKVTKSKIT